MECRNLVVVAAVFGVCAASPAWAQSTQPAPEVTYAKDIAPILQRSCESCHRADGAAAMAFQTYEQVRPWARAIKTRTGVGPKAGVMPPWYVEKNIGIQKYKNDPSLSDKEIALIAKWADSGAPTGNPADLPPALKWDDTKWAIGTPDLIVKTTPIVVKANTPDWWGEIASVPVGLTEDRYVVGLEVKEVNDVASSGSDRSPRRFPLRPANSWRCNKTGLLREPLRRRRPAMACGLGGWRKTRHPQGPQPHQQQKMEADN